ncbi:hypothetical protein PCANC_28141 [Puccinia coronata f. sp. avenae]|uniref:Arrestin C-terminal-like domain-containing protein n=1 Tax=Puccinia coronata f. sp. avenae TaxID=200324 RepID=A0A2N5TJH3_9BASI|nr:hypothetical protein PCANC_28141 [Puccinia coronata f. sp. avenae]
MTSTTTTTTSSHSSTHHQSPSRSVVQPLTSTTKSQNETVESSHHSSSISSFPSFMLPTRPKLPEPAPTPSTSRSNLAQLIMKQKETRDYKKNTHPKAFFIKPSSGSSEKPSLTATSSQIVRSPADFEFPPLSFDHASNNHLHGASHITPVGILRSQQYNSTTHEPQSLLAAADPTSPSPQALHSPASDALFAGSPNNHNIYSDTDTQAQLAWLGYHQELRRDWDFWSSLSLSTLNIGTIPGAFLGILTAMEWGGPCVIFWGYIIGMIIVLCLSAVVAEIASAYPVAGAMLTWTFKLARANPKLRDWARFISWVVGTLLFVAHVVVQVALTSQCTLMVVSVINRFYPPWIIESGWQTFLLNAGHLTLCGLLLCTAPIRSPRLWKILGALSILLYVIICVGLIVGPRLAGHQVISTKHLAKMLVTFHNDTSFKSKGAAVDAFVFLMGTSLVSLAFGAEASAHLAEETRTPAATVPKALFASTLVSYILGLTVNLCLIAALLPLTPKESQHKLHLIDMIFTHCTPPIATMILVCLLLLMFFQDVAQLFAASRFTWALARDNAFPGSKIWRKVSGSWRSILRHSADDDGSARRIPRMAIVLLVACGLATAAAIEFKEGIFSDSLITSATYLLVFCYLAPLVIYLSCDPDVLEYDGRNVWRIPSLSRSCTWISVISLIVVLLLMACPAGLPITIETWSWSPLITLVFTLASSIGWITYGSSRYIGPIKSITFWTTGQEVDFPRPQYGIGGLHNLDKSGGGVDEASPRNPGIFHNHIARQRADSGGQANSTQEYSVDSEDPANWPITITRTTVTEILIHHLHFARSSASFSPAIMAGGTRSHSPPLPPNATYNHPIILLNILPSAKLFTAGSKVTGMLEVICKERNSVALGQLAIEFFGIEELKLLDHSAQSSIHGPHKCVFQGPALPPSNAVATSEAPIGGHYYTALRGRTKFPFAFPLPSKLPSSTNFNDKARLCYGLKATCQVLSIESRQNVLVTKSKNVQIVEKLLDWNDTKYHEPVEMRGELRDPTGTGAGVWAEVKIDKMLHYSQNSSHADDGLIRAQLTVKNSTRRMLSGGVNAKICRRLVLPQDPGSLTDSSRIQVVRNCTFRGIDYEFPAASGQAKTVKLICQLPSTTQDDIEHADHNSSCLSVRGLKLFSVDMFLRVELELGALSNDLIVDLPIYVTHASSLPKELRIRSTPATIEHVPSPNPISHLAKPDSSSGRASRNTSRSSSPHPPSLQPGNISRSASPRLSVSIGPGDWGGMQRSAPPSPAGSAHFSPLPSPQPSPRPPSRFSSPLPFSPPSAVPNHHHPAMSGVPPGGNSFAHPAPWYNPSSPFPPYPHPSVTPTPTQDHRSYVDPSSSQYTPPQPIFSPPTTPWHRQTVPTTFDPPSTYAPSPSHPNHSNYQASNAMSHFPPVNQPPANHGPEEPFSPSAYQNYDAGSPLPPNWRIRHQSLPTVPAPPSQHYCPPDSYYDGESTSEHSSALSRKSSSSRRTSEPINQYSAHTAVQQLPASGGIAVRKRALPTPPQVCQVADPAPPGPAPSDNHLTHTSDHHYRIPAPITTDPPTAIHHSRLETIGEVGESRTGTLSAKQLPQNTLNLLAGSGDSEDEDGEDGRHPRQRRESARVVSHPRGMRPRRSDGSDSVQALEDMVAMQDEQRSADAALTWDPSSDQTPTLNNHRAVFDEPSHSAQLHDRSPPRQTSPDHHTPRERSSSSPHLQSSSRSKQPTGLANLVHFLNRATSTEPPRASSAQESTPHTGNLSVDSGRDHDSSMSVQSCEDKVARTPTPSYTGSALRMKSTRISYGETLIDAVPSPTNASKSCSADVEQNTSARQAVTDWKPPATLASSSSHHPRTSIAEQMDFCDNQPIDQHAPVGRESIAPDALFPQFDPEQPLAIVNQAVPSPPRLSEQLAKAVKLPVDGDRFSPLRGQRATSPLVIPSDSPTVKKKGSKTQRKPSQPTPKKLASETEASSSPSRIVTERASASPNISIPQDACAQPQPTTIVERLRSQNASTVAHDSTIQPRQATKDSKLCRKELPATDKPQETPPPSAPTFYSGLRLTTKEADLRAERSQSHVADARPTPMRPTLPTPPAERTTRVDEIVQPAPLFPSNIRHQNHSIAPLFPRLSPIPKSSTPLSLAGSSLYQSSSNSTPHRPLPISPSCAHEAKMASLNPTPDIELLESASAKISCDAPVSTRALFSAPMSQPAPQAMPEKTSSQISASSRLTTASLGAPCSPTSPTHLSRKSRIKRQMSSAQTADDSASVYSKRASRVGQQQEGEMMLSSISRVPGGWNEEESNEIEAQLIEALKETNLAVQKATSRRLSTPDFVHSPAKNRSAFRASMFSTSQLAPVDRDNRLGLDRLRASMSVADQRSTDEEPPASRRSVDRSSREPESRSSVIDWPSTSQPDESMKSMSFDEDTPISLTSGEYKSIRGGRGGRVSSVVGQWAKLTAADGAGILSPRKTPLENKMEEAAGPGTSSSSLLISTRGLSIRPKNTSHPSQYSITGLLSRNSSLTRQLSGSRSQEPRAFGLQDTNRRSQIILEREAPPPTKLPLEGTTLPPAPSFQTHAIAGRRGLPAVPPAASAAAAAEEKKVGAAKLGYRNLANRLSGGGKYPAPAAPSQPSSKSASSSSSSISSLASITPLSARSSADEPAAAAAAAALTNHRPAKRISLLARSDRHKLSPIHTLPSQPASGPISDLVKRWES